MKKEKAQIAMEYMILTAFILVSVGIIFTFSFLNYSQNIRVTKATEALAKMSNAVDDVYVRGEGNTRFVSISFPEGMQRISIVHKCAEESDNAQGTVAQCGEGCSATGYGCVDFSAISMEVQLIGGTHTMVRETKAKISEAIGEISSGDYAGSTYSIKVSWTDTGIIMLKKV